MSVTSESYDQFIEKFEHKKTTDDCYTPPSVYDAVAGWVSNEYGVERESFVRPFWPGGDYESFNYDAGSVVVDNPPFSIYSKIISFYVRNGVKFFLFAPTLTMFSSASSEICSIPTGVKVTYENGAIVNTSFSTNLEDCSVRTAPALYQSVDEANKKNLKSKKKHVPKYIYPDEVITAAMVAMWSKYGVPYRLARGDFVRIRALDAQRLRGKAIFGFGLLLSDRAAADRAAADRAAADRAAADRAAADRWDLSDRERAIVNEMNKKSAAEDRPTRAGKGERIMETNIFYQNRKEIGRISRERNVTVSVATDMWAHEHKVAKAGAARNEWDELLIAYQRGKDMSLAELLG